jgi:hypothetical protein
MKRYALYISLGLFGTYALICIFCLMVGEPMPFMDKPIPEMQFLIIFCEVLGTYVAWGYANLTDPKEKYNQIK